ncbi:MAG: N-6 DNA methylase [Patescibacteria group bacterium]
MNDPKEKIRLLIDKYEIAKSAGKIKSYTEEETKKDFILPIFEALGWDVHNKNEVSAEENLSSSDRVDYGFYLNGRAKFYLEAKSLKVDLHREEYAKQAIRYSWNKGVTWAVLTDFESIKVFNTQDAKATLAAKLLFEISYDRYIECFDQLSLLSRESFEKNLIDTEAEKFGKKFQKIPVTSLLFNDLNECREILTKSLKAWNSKIAPQFLDEGVQKLLDRLIFLRVAEDRGIEPPTLIPLLREWKNRKDQNEVPLYKHMVDKFRELDKTYNSNLFSEHPFEEWEEYGDATEKVIQILYGKPGYYEYDFKAMPADVLGTVYENYLGYKLSQSKKGVEVHKDAKKRKEQGIYYTPHFIVEYIVKNALGPVLEKCNTIEDLKKIKVLDPACGSGSFLVQALELINEKYKKMGAPGNVFTKIQILLENIYGVDLDEQAVEIARLNLLVGALNERQKLPSLDKNIKNGNSLISGTDSELKKHFGANFRNKKPFNWEEEFPEVFKQGGFDVIIGNPPYIKEFVNKEAFNGLHDSPYYQGKMDIWTMFACISIDLLKDGGILSFIAPNNWVSNAGADIFRDKILKDGELKSFLDFGDYKVFEQAGIQTMIFTFKKGKPDEKYKVSYLRIPDRNIAENELISRIFGEKTEIEIKPEKLLGHFLIFTESNKDILLEKIKSKQNYHINEKDVGNGIDVLQDFITEKHLQGLSDKTIKKGDGIFILSEDEIKELSPTKPEDQYLRPYYTTKEINRYLSIKNTSLRIIYADSYFREHIEQFPNLKKHLDKFSKILTSVYAPYGLHRAREERFFEGHCIFSIRKTIKPSFSYVDFPCYVTRAFIILKLDKVNLKYVLGLLNSNIMHFWLRNKGKLQGDQLQIDKEPLLDLPIYIADEASQKLIISYVDKIILLNKEFHDVEENSNEWERLKSEIGRTDKKIDEEVYKLYGLTEEEIKTVEGEN